MMSAPASPPWISQYRALTGAVGLVELERTQIELRGADRASFLHNLCTNEIRKLPAGAGCEAFLTTVQGKTLGHVLVFAGAETHVLDTVAGQAETILAHLDHYLITEQVTLTDCSPTRGEYLLAGPGAEALLKTLGAAVGAAPLAHATVEVAGRELELRRVELTLPGGFLLSAARDAWPDLRQALLAAGAIVCASEAFEAARIERGFPCFGRDITERNLPQEVDRDRLAISFVKGCYLGQETVARIDALGHVNRMLRGLRFAGSSVPEPGTPLFWDGQPVGEVTSSTFSPRLEAPLALAYLRTTAPSAAPLDSPVGPAERVALPLG